VQGFAGELWILALYLNVRSFVERNLATSAKCNYLVFLKIIIILKYILLSAW